MPSRKTLHGRGVGFEFRIRGTRLDGSCSALPATQTKSMFKSGIRSGGRSRHFSFWHRAAARMRNRIGNSILGVPLKIQKNTKLLSNNPCLNEEFAPVAAPYTSRFGTARQRACGIESGISFLGFRSKFKKIKTIE